MRTGTTWQRGGDANKCTVAVAPQWHQGRRIRRCGRSLDVGIGFAATEAAAAEIAATKAIATRAATKAAAQVADIQIAVAAAFRVPSR